MGRRPLPGTRRRFILGFFVALCTLSEESNGDGFLNATGPEWIELISGTESTVWVLAIGCIYRIDEDASTRIPLEEEEERALAISQIGLDTWLGTSQGLRRIVGDTVHPHFEQLFGNTSVTAILPLSRSVWVGTSNGVIQIAIDTLQHTGLPDYTRILGGESGAAETIHDLTTLKGEAWIASNRNAYYLVGTEPEPLFDAEQPVDSLQALGDDLWIITPTPQKQGFVPYLVQDYVPLKAFTDLKITTLARIGGDLWAGDAHGKVHRYNGGQISFTDQDDPGSVSGIVEDANGRVWISTQEGLFRRNQDRFEELPSALGSLGVAFLALVPNNPIQGEQDLWMATFSSGAFKFVEGVDATAEISGFGLFEIGSQKISLSKRLDVESPRLLLSDDSPWKDRNDQELEILRLEEPSTCAHLFNERRIGSQQQETIVLEEWMQPVRLCLRDRWGNIFGPKDFDLIYIPIWLIGPLVVIALVVLTARLTGSTFVLYLLDSDTVRTSHWVIALDLVFVFPRVMRRTIIGLLAPYCRRLYGKSKPAWEDNEERYRWETALAGIQQVLVSESICLLETEGGVPRSVALALATTCLEHKSLWKKTGKPFPILIPSHKLQLFDTVRNHILGELERIGYVRNQLFAELLLDRECFVFIFFGEDISPDEVRVLEEFREDSWAGNFIVIQTATPTEIGYNKVLLERAQTDETSGGPRRSLEQSQPSAGAAVDGSHVEPSGLPRDSTAGAL